MSEKKIGAGHFGAMARLGLKELRNAATPSRDSVADNEIGLYGTLTQGEIAEARGGPGQGPEQEGNDKLSLDELRGNAEKKGKEAERGQDRDDNQRPQERGPER